MDTYQLIATGAILLGGAVTLIKAWTGLNERQKQHAKMLTTHDELIATIQTTCVDRQAARTEEQIRMGAVLSRLETMLEERTEKRV